MTVDAVVVGGGIGGAALAGLLGRRGKRVIVLERSVTAADWVRPEILWPRSTETLCALSPRERWIENAATPLRGIEFHNGDHVLPLFHESVMSDARVQPWSTNPNATREHLLSLETFEVRRGVEVISVLKEGTRVVGVRTRDVRTDTEADVLGRFTIGDDGASSLVRAACNIPMAVQQFPVEFLCFGSEWPENVPQGRARVWWNPRVTDTGIVCLLIAPLPHHRCAALVPVVSSTFAANRAVSESWDRFCHIDPTIAAVLGGRQFPAGLKRVARPWGHAARYGADGALLMGDAAHPVSPAGGQGANMSIADAIVLADLVGTGADNVLAQYEARRRRANAASIRPTRGADIFFGAPRWLSPMHFAPFLAGRLALCPTLQRRFVRSVAGTFLGAAA